jgi:copper(I)-binding protein
MRLFLNLSLSLLVAAAMLVPITADAKTPKMVPVQTKNGKSVQLHTMMVHGQMMILVPMDMACEVFNEYHINC